MLSSVGLQDAKTSKIQFDPGYLKLREDDEPMENNYMYRQLIGKLLYIAVNTRPDIAASMSILSQHTVGPTKTDWNEAKGVAKYLKGTKESKLKLGNTQSEHAARLIGFADADWAQNEFDRKSNN